MKNSKSELFNMSYINSSIVMMEHESTFRVYEINDHLEIEDWVQYKLDLNKTYNGGMDEVVYEPIFSWKND